MDAHQAQPQSQHAQVVLFVPMVVVIAAKQFAERLMKLPWCVRIAVSVTTLCMVSFLNQTMSERMAGTFMPWITLAAAMLLRCLLASDGVFSLRIPPIIGIVLALYAICEAGDAAPITFVRMILRAFLYCMHVIPYFGLMDQEFLLFRGRTGAFLASLAIVLVAISVFDLAAYDALDPSPFYFWDNVAFTLVVWTNVVALLSPKWRQLDMFRSAAEMVNKYTERWDPEQRKVIHDNMEEIVNSLGTPKLLLLTKVLSLSLFVATFMIVVQPNVLASLLAMVPLTLLVPYAEHVTVSPAQLKQPSSPAPANWLPCSSPTWARRKGQILPLRMSQFFDDLFVIPDLYSLTGVISAEGIPPVTRVLKVLLSHVQRRDVGPSSAGAMALGLLNGWAEAEVNVAFAKAVLESDEMLKLLSEVKVQAMEAKAATTHDRAPSNIERDGYTVVDWSITMIEACTVVLQLMSRCCFMFDASQPLRYATDRSLGLPSTPHLPMPWADANAHIRDQLARLCPKFFGALHANCNEWLRAFLELALWGEGPSGEFRLPKPFVVWQGNGGMGTLDPPPIPQTPRWLAFRASCCPFLQLFVSDLTIVEQASIVVNFSYAVVRRFKRMLLPPFGTDMFVLIAAALSSLEQQNAMGPFVDDQFPESLLEEEKPALVNFPPNSSPPALPPNLFPVAGHYVLSELTFVCADSIHLYQVNINLAAALLNIINIVLKHPGHRELQCPREITVKVCAGSVAALISGVRERQDTLLFGSATDTSSPSPELKVCCRRRLSLILQDGMHVIQLLRQLDEKTVIAAVKQHESFMRWIFATIDGATGSSGDSSAPAESLTGVEDITRDLAECILASCSVHSASKLSTVGSSAVPADAECAVCLRQLASSTPDTFSRVNACHHTFHRSCLFLWMLNHSTCPVCRSTI